MPPPWLPGPVRPVGSLAALLSALLATALLSGCADNSRDAMAEEAPFEDSARAIAQARSLPAPVSLRVEGDAMGSAGESWTWPVAELAPTVFLVRFEFSPTVVGSPGYLLQEARVQLRDPLGAVQGQYSTPFTAGQYQETVLEFQAPPYAAVTPGNWTVDLSAGPASLAHYLLEVQVAYAAFEEPAALDAEAGAA